MTSDLNAEDVKNKLFHTLKSRGVLDSLKSQLRKQLIRELQDTTGLPLLRSTVKESSTQKDSDGIPLLQRAANSIVAEYLKSCNFEYTLSTFLPESGTALEKMFSSKDILHLLNIDPNSKLYANLEYSLSSTTDHKGFLWDFLIEVAAFYNERKCDVNIQTEDTLPTQISGSLEEKLTSVEKEYQEKEKLAKLDKKQGVEEKLIAMQKKYEMQKKSELEEEVKRFRCNELSKLRMVERQKYEAEVKAIRREYDEEFNIKNQALRALEKEMLDRMQRLQEVQQTEAYTERQKLLEEMRSFKEREADFENRISIQERAQKLEEERLVNKVEKLKVREDAIKEKEIILEQRFNAELENFKTDYERQHSARYQELIRQESHLEADRSKLDEERKIHLKCQEELATFKEKCFQLQCSVEASNLFTEDLKKQKLGLERKLEEMKDYRTLKEKEVILTKDIDHLTQRLTETNLHCKEQEKRHHRLVKDLTEKTGKPSEELVILRREFKNAKEKYREIEKALYEERNALEIELESQIQRANHFQKMCEDQLSTQRFLETEVENLKMMQEQTERLLSMELRHQNANNSNVSSSTRRKQKLVSTAQKASSRRKIAHDSLRRKEVPPITGRRLETEESSTMDESSLASMIEDKKSIEKFEKEAAALDASYRDFQSRMIAPSKSVASIPSSLTFRRLASYHSVHSPIAEIGGFNLTSQGSKYEFRPLMQVSNESDLPGDVGQYAPAEMQNKKKSKLQNMYSFRTDSIPDKKSFGHESDSDIESGQLNEDDSVALSMHDLSPPLGKNRKIHGHVVKKRSTAGLFQPNEENGNTQVNPSTDVVAMSRNMKSESKSLSGTLEKENNKTLETQNISFPLFNNTDVFVDQADNPTAQITANFGNVGNFQQSVSGRHVESLVSEFSSNRADVSSSNTCNYGNEGTLDGVEARKAQHSIARLDMERRSKKSSASSDKSLSNGSLNDNNSHAYTKSPSHEDSSAMREKIDVGIPKTDKRRHSTELDMAEIEERRRRDSENFQEEPNDYDKEDVSCSKSSRSADGKSEVDFVGNSLKSTHEDETAEKKDDNNDDPPIDPVMVKYMQMIKQRRESDNKTIEEKSVYNASKVDPDDDSNNQSHVSIGKDDEEVSVGKLSDDDFNWE